MFFVLTCRLPWIQTFFGLRPRLTRKVTDYYLPSSLTGYIHAPVYPLSRPDVAKARALARGHTRGGHATLYVCPRTFCATTE